MSRAALAYDLRRYVESIPQVLIDDLRARKPGAQAAFIVALSPAIDLLPDSKKAAAFLALPAAAEWLESHKPKKSVAEYLATKLLKGKAPRKRGSDKEEFPVGSDTELGGVPSGTYRTRRSKGQFTERRRYRAWQDENRNHIEGWDSSPSDPAREYQRQVFENLEDDGFLDILERDTWMLTRAGYTQSEIGREFGIPQRTISRILERLCERFGESLDDDDRPAVCFTKTRKSRTPRKRKPRFLMAVR